MWWSCVIISLIIYCSAVSAGGVFRVLLYPYCVVVASVNTCLMPCLHEEQRMQATRRRIVTKKPMQGTRKCLDTKSKTMTNLPWYLGWELSWPNVWSGSEVITLESHHSAEWDTMRADICTTSNRLPSPLTRTLEYPGGPRSPNCKHFRQRSWFPSNRHPSVLVGNALWITKQFTKPVFITSSYQVDH